MGGRVGAVVLAAGAGRRMGGVPKALLRRDDEPLLLRQLRLLREAGVRDAVVVLGHHAPYLEGLLQRPHAGGSLEPQQVRNPDPDRGTASSLQCGLRALPDGVETILVLLADQPLLEAADITAMLRSWGARGEGVDLLVPRHDTVPGHPIVFGASLRAAVNTLPGGVPAWRRAHRERVHFADFAHARYTTDVDTVADLERLRVQHGVVLDTSGLPA